LHENYVIKEQQEFNKFHFLQYFSISSTTKISEIMLQNVVSS